MTTRRVMLLILCMLPAVVQADEPAPRAPWKERAVLRAGQVVQGDYFALVRMWKFPASSTVTCMPPVVRCLWMEWSTEM